MKCYAVKFCKEKHNDVYGAVLDLQGITSGLQQTQVLQEAADKGYWTGFYLFNVAYDDGAQTEVEPIVLRVFPEATVQDYTFGSPFNYQDLTGTATEE
jgi:hypothetical protein